MKIEVSEIVEDKNGCHFIHYTREEEFPESEGRHSDLCVVCGFPTYPECMKYCRNFREDRE